MESTHFVYECELTRPKRAYILLHCGELDGRWPSSIVTLGYDTSTVTVRTADESHLAHWLLTYDVYRHVLASTPLAIGADLKTAMRAAIVECEVDGWAVENDGAYGFFFCSREGERREVRIQAIDPAESIPLNNTSARG